MRSIFLEPDKITVEQMKRVERNRLLEETVDRINPLRWEAMTDEKREEWRVYRQALLDVPNQPGFPYEINWPVKPS